MSYPATERQFIASAAVEGPGPQPKSRTLLSARGPQRYSISGIRYWMKCMSRLLGPPSSSSRYFE